MNRQQFINRFIQNNQPHHHKKQKNRLQTFQTPATIKRMQIHHKTIQKKCRPFHIENTEQLAQKHNNGYGNRKVLVLQKVKNLYKKKDMMTINKNLNYNYISSQLDSLISKEGVLISSGLGSPSKYPHKFQTQNLKSEVPSPIKYFTGFTKRSESAGGFCRLSKQKKSNEFYRPTTPCKKQSIKSTSSSAGQKTLVSEKIILEKRCISPKKQTNKVIYLSKHEDNKTKMHEKFKQKNSKLKLLSKKTEIKKFIPIPKISSKSYIICEKVKDFFQPNNLKIHLAFKSKVRMQVASLTKIMTCLLAIELCQRFKINPRTEKIRVGKFESNIGGTSAHIKNGDSYTLWDLFHGLMLPSGNDASLAIAVWGGKVLYSQKMPDKDKKDYYERFIQEMNKKAKTLQMSKTTYANSHGLVNCINRSCAHDIAILSEYAMRNPIFRSIVSTKSYKTKISIFKKQFLQKKDDNNEQNLQTLRYQNDEDDDYGDESDEQNTGRILKSKIRYLEEDIYIGEREVNWENTHKLLHQYPNQYIGIKTGVTTAAGPCLASCVVSDCGRTFFIIVLNCKKLSTRFKETEQLRKWVFKQENIKKKIKKNEENSSRMTSIMSEDNGLQNDEKEEYGPEDD